MNRKNIAIAVISDLVTDQRIRKVAGTLQKQLGDVTVICRKSKQSPNRLSFRVNPIRLSVKKGFLFYAEFNVRLFLKLVQTKADLIVSNDADTLLPCYYAAKLKKIPVVFDSHEIMSEVPEVVNRPFVKSIWRWIENRYIPKVQFKYTVCNSLRDYYNCGFSVVRNVPFAIKPFTEPDKTGSDKIILYQGSVNMGRGIELMISAMPHIRDAVFWIIGDGYHKSELEELAKQSEAGSRIIFKGQISPEELKEVTPLADLGISLEENLGLNYFFALPNKVMDCIQSRVPLLVSDFPEMGRLVKTYEVGEVASNRHPIELAKQINQMLTNPTQRKLWIANCDKAASELCWEKEENVLLELYSRALGTSH